MSLPISQDEALEILKSMVQLEDGSASLEGLSFAGRAQLRWGGSLCGRAQLRWGLGGFNLRWRR